MVPSNGRHPKDLNNWPIAGTIRDPGGNGSTSLSPKEVPVKKILVLSAIITVLCAFGVYAGEGCPQHAKADAKAAGHDASCAAMGDMSKVLKADLAQMEKGVKPADQDAFLKTHADNLKKLVEMQGKMAANRKNDKACCFHPEECDASIKVLKADLEKMGKPMTEAQKTDFFKAHPTNLKKFLDVKAKCETVCKAKGAGAKPADKKPAEKKVENK
jgi:hypothetical protein